MNAGLLAVVTEQDPEFHFWMAVWWARDNGLHFATSGDMIDAFDAHLNKTDPAE